MTPQLKKESNVTNRFLTAKVTKNVNFVGEKLDITKLTVAQVMEIQELSANFGDAPTEADNLKILTTVIRSGAAELRELTDEEFNGFPLDELSRSLFRSIQGLIMTPQLKNKFHIGIFLTLPWQD